MKPITQKKYFVKDESLHRSDDDMFNYSDIAKVLDDIISTNNPPYNVAIIGKWGLGKSSLINLATTKYKNDSDYIIQEINAWKYEKESLRKVFLKQLWQGMDKKKSYSFETIKKNFSDIIEDETYEEPKKQNNLKFLGILLVFIVISIIVFAIYKCVQAYIYETDICTLNFWGKTFLSYCKNIGTILFAPTILALLKILIDDFHSKKEKKIELNFPVETTDDYEMFLESRIKEKIKTNPNLKVITIIDDLDRLSVDKIVEALDAIKAFVGFERCVFIVPFDDEIIKRALDKKRTKAINDQADIIESELILDKLFQFRIYLPPILDLDIHEYAFKLAKQEVSDFMNDYCSEALLKKVIERVLIYPGVSTPRQVKKLLNAFINNYMIAHAREASGKIQKQMLTSEEGTMQLAVIAVLQSDFNSFYDLLFKDYSCINKIISVHQGQSDWLKLPEYLQSFFEKRQTHLTEYKLKKEHESLLNFLTTTQKYMTSNLATVLFLAQDNICIKLGDEIQRRTINALRSANSNTVKELLSEHSDVVDAIIYHLNSEDTAIENVIKASIDVFDAVEEKYQSSLSQSIIDRTLEQPSGNVDFLSNASTKNILAIKSIGENDAFNSKFLSTYISSLITDDITMHYHVFNALGVLIENYEALDKASRDELKKTIDNYIKNESVKANYFFDCVQYSKENGFFEIFALPWFEKLCYYIDSENDFSDDTLLHLENTFELLKDFVEANCLAQAMKELFKYSKISQTISNIMSSFVSENKIFKELLSSEIATPIANILITHDFNQSGKQICEILENLPYVVTNENGEDFDNFTLNFENSYDLDNILLYCGENGYLSFLEKTIDRLTECVFVSEENDELFENLVVYFSPEQKGTLENKLIESSKYKDKKNYHREKTIYKILSNKNCVDILSKVTNSTLIVQINANYNKPIFFEFVSEVIGKIHRLLDDETINSYVNVLLNKFSSCRYLCLNALNLIPNRMSNDLFKTTFKKIISEVQQAEIEVAFDLIYNHENYTQNDDSDLFDFLMKCLPIITCPEKALVFLNNKFHMVTNISQIIQNTTKNANYNPAILENTVASLLDNVSDESEIALAIVSIANMDNTTQLIVNIMSNLKKHNMINVLSEVNALISNVTTANTLLNIVNIACSYLDLSVAKTLIINCLDASLNQLNMIETSNSIMRTINNYRDDFRTLKSELADVLRKGFLSSNNEAQKELILQVVTSLKIKPQFKKTLEGEALNFYNKWIH